MATYKYLIDYFDKDLANKSWNKEKRIEYMSYDDWLSSNGYSECWSLFGKRFDSEVEAVEFMITDFHHTDSRTRRIILMEDNKDDWEMDSTYDSLDYPELEYRGDTYATD